MTRLTNGTLVVVADGEKALFLTNEGDHEHPVLTVQRVEEQENPPNREQAANRPGRFNDGPSVQRSAVDDTDWHRLAQDRFAADLAERLYKQAHRGAFDRLVLVAADRILGELRHELHTEVADRLVAEIPKVLTNHPVDEIETIVRREMAA